MFTVTIQDTENKNEQDKIISLSYTITGVYETFDNVVNDTEVFTEPKDSLELTEKAVIIGQALKDNITNIVTALKTASEVGDLGQMKVIVL